MAYAGSRFASSVADALAGVEGVTECAFVESDKVDGLSFFSTPCKFGVSFKCGVCVVVWRLLLVSVLVLLLE